MTPILVTGIGAVTPLGRHDGAGLLAAIRAGRPAPADADGARRVPDFDPETVGPARDWRRMSRASMFTVAAGLLALRDAGIADEKLGEDTALVVGSRLGCLSLFEAFHGAWRDEGPRAVSPTVFSTGVLNAPAGHLAIERGIRGPCHSLVGGEAVGAEAVALAAELLAAGVVRRAIAIGVEECPPLLVQALRVGRAAPPRGKFVPSEGAVALVLEAGSRPGGAEGRGVRLGGISLGDVPRGRAVDLEYATAIHAALGSAGVGSKALAAIAATARGGAPGIREDQALSKLFPRAARHAIGPVLGDGPGLASAAAVACAAVLAREGRPTLASAPAPSGACVAVVFTPIA